MTSATILIGVLALLATVNSDGDMDAKKKMMEHKVNLGWPNFFNPEKAILRKKEGIEKNKKASEGDKSSLLAAKKSNAELLEENRLANLVKDAENEHEWDDPLDFKIKDGLRGIVMLLNSTDDVTNSRPEAISEENVQLIQEQLANETDVYEELSEVTDDGLRLATPLVRMRHTAALGKYGAEVTFFHGDDPISLLYYGNWCGKGGRIAPVDALDSCCLEHAKCYGRQVKPCPDVWQRPYNTMYAWTVLDDTPYCVRSGSTCTNNVCECDLAASACMLRALQQRGLVPREDESSEEEEDEQEGESFREEEKDQEDHSNEEETRSDFE